MVAGVTSSYEGRVLLKNVRSYCICNVTGGAANYLWARETQKKKKKKRTHVPDIEVDGLKQKSWPTGWLHNR